MNINANISVNKSETLNNTRGRVSAESKEVTRSKIDMGLKKTLEGTEISDVWQNPKDATYYALAVLDREKASMKFAERIRELDVEIGRLTMKTDSASGKIDKLKLLLLKKNLMSDRNELNSDLRIVSASGKGVEPPFSFEKENSEILGFLQNEFVIGVGGDGPAADVVTQTVTDMFTRSGFIVKRTTGKDADLIIKISTSIQPSEEPVDEWYYCRWGLVLNASDPVDGDLIFSSSQNGKSGQLTKDESKSRAVYDMNKKVGLLAAKVLAKLTGREE